MKNWLKENRYVFLATFIVVMCFMRMWIYKGIEVSFVSINEQPVEYGVFYNNVQSKQEISEKEIKKYVTPGVHLVHLNIPAKKIESFALNFDQPNIYVHGLRIAGKKTVSFDQLDDFIPTVTTVDDPYYRDTKKNIFVLSAPKEIKIEGKKLIHFPKLFLMFLSIGTLSFLLKKSKPFELSRKHYVYVGILTAYLMVCFSFLYSNTNTSLYKIFALKFFNKVGEITISADNEKDSFQILNIFGAVAPDNIFENNMLISKKLTGDFKEDYVKIKPQFNGTIKLTFNSVLEIPIEVRKIKLNEKTIQAESKSIIDNNNMIFTLEKQKVENEFKVKKGKEYKISFETRYIPMHFSDVKKLTGLSRTKFIFSFLNLFIIAFLSVNLFKRKNYHLKNVFLALGGMFAITYVIGYLSGLAGFSEQYNQNKQYLYDLIGSVWGGRDPYHLPAGTGQYPPLINLVFYLFSNVADFKGPSNSDISGTAFNDLYTTGSLLKIQIWMMMWTILFLIQFYQKFDASHFQKSILLLLFTLSYPLINCLYVGNQMIVCVVFSTYYLFHYNDDNNKTRELSYIALAISAGCKIYPAIFGVLTLFSNRKKEAVRLIVYGIIFFFLPFFFFKGGISNFEQILSGISGWSKNVASYLYSFRGFTLGFWYDRSNDRLLEAIFSKQTAVYFDMFFLILNYLALLVGFICFPIVKKNWMRSLFLGLICLVFNARGYHYCSIILFASFVLFLNEEYIFSVKKIIYTLLFIGITFPDFLIYREFSAALSSNILFVLLIFDMGQEFIHVPKNERVKIYKNLLA